MNDILQIIGSLASILGIPLAAYLFIKSQVQKYGNIRREIVKRLSHQIGEGRAISLFEMNAVIDSLVRENRLKSDAISPDSIVEDLVAETVSSPLLESGRKDGLMKELSELHTLGRIYAFGNSSEEPDKLKTAVEIKEKLAKRSENERLGNADKIFGLASIVGVIFTAGITIINLIEGSDLLPKIFNSESITSLFLGIGVSLFAALLTAFFSRPKNSKGEV